MAVRRQGRPGYNELQMVLRAAEPPVSDKRRMGMIRRCKSEEFEAIYALINEAAVAYKGVIPEDRWHEPYMPRAELRGEVNAGVCFWGFEEEGQLVGVMGIQDVEDVTLIRHAYVRPDRQQRGIGGRLLNHLRQRTQRPLLIGTWAAAEWAVRFYEKHGFRQVTPAEKNRLLARYWSIPERQIETSVVLADEVWFANAGRRAQST